MFIWPTGKTYEGGWQKDKQHGIATITNTNGVTKLGLWENGKRIKWINNDDHLSTKAANSDKQTIEY